MTIAETGSVRGTIEATSIEINGHVEGQVTADTIIIGKSAVIKGDVFFKNTLIGCTHLIIFLTIYIASINPIASARI